MDEERLKSAQNQSLDDGQIHTLDEYNQTDTSEALEMHGNGGNIWSETPGSL